MSPEGPTAVVSLEICINTRTQRQSNNSGNLIGTSNHTHTHKYTHTHKGGLMKDITHNVPHHLLLTKGEPREENVVNSLVADVEVWP